MVYFLKVTPVGKQHCTLPNWFTYMSRDTSLVLLQCSGRAVPPAATHSLVQMPLMTNVWVATWRAGIIQTNVAFAAGARKVNTPCLGTCVFVSRSP